MATPNLRIFYLVGPTAVGKTSIAAEVAEACHCEIISADAFQVYQGMDILTAKPSQEILQRVPHHLVGTIPLTKSFDAAQFQAAASAAAAQIYARGKFPLVVGGTGLYVRALTHGLAELPTADPELRSELEPLSLEQLNRRYQELDPKGAMSIDSKNPRRLIRAIEVCLLTGKPFSSFRTEWRIPPENVAGVFLQRERRELYQRIDLRTEEMVKAGLFEEVKHLGQIGATACQVIGLAEARGFLAGDLTPEKAVDQIRQATRHYAKRQITWFQRETHFNPMDAERGSLATEISHMIRGFFRM